MKLLVDLAEFGIAKKVVLLDHKAGAQVQQVIAEAAAKCAGSVKPTGEIPKISRDCISSEKQAWARSFIATCPVELVTV